MYEGQATNSVDAIRCYQHNAALQQKQSQVGAISGVGQPSEIATELQLLHEALDTLGQHLNMITSRIGPVAVFVPSCGAQCSEALKEPAMSPTAVAISNARGTVLGFCDQVRDQLNALRC